MVSASHIARYTAIQSGTLTAPNPRLQSLIHSDLFSSSSKVTKPLIRSVRFKIVLIFGQYLLGFWHKAHHKYCNSSNTNVLHGGFQIFV